MFAWLIMGTALLAVTLIPTAQSCASTGICGGSAICTPQPVMSTQIQCQCAPSYGCGQYGCYKLRARASKNLYAVDGETSSSLEAFRRLREYSQEESGRVEPLRELSARPIASDVPSTGDRRHHADVAVSPNEAFLSCCMDRQLPDACLQKCNFHSYTKQALTAMFFKQDACPLEAMREMQYCAAQGRDHRECCIRNGVTNTIAADKCLVFCDQRPGIVTQLDITYLACFDRFENMKTCFWDDIERTQRRK